MNLSQLYDKLKVTMATAEAEVAKAVGGNKAAGTRVRKLMQDVKATAQEIRAAALTLTKTPEA